MIASNISSIIASTLAANNASDLAPLALRTASVESSGRVDARNTRSSATGLFQFIESTWGAMMPGVPFSLATDPVQNTIAFINLTRSNQAALKKALDRNPENWEIYVAHFAGATTAAKVLSASDETPLNAVFSTAAMNANPHLSKLRTVGAYKIWVENKFNQTPLPENIQQLLASSANENSMPTLGESDKESAAKNEENQNWLAQMMEGMVQSMASSMASFGGGLMMLFVTAFAGKSAQQEEPAPIEENTPPPATPKTEPPAPPLTQEAKIAAAQVAIPDGCTISNGVCSAPEGSQPVPNALAWDSSKLFGIG